MRDVLIAFVKLAALKNDAMRHVEIALCRTYVCTTYVLRGDTSERDYTSHQYPSIRSLRTYVGCFVSAFSYDTYR